jgi:protein TonB
MVVAPYMTADTHLPAVKVVGVLISAPPPAAPLPPAAAPKKGSLKQGKKQQKPAVKSSQPGRIVAPMDVPEEIGEEDFTEFGVPNGVEGGVVGGVEGGVPGGVLDGILDTGPSQTLNAIPVRQARLIKRVDPVYPLTALRARIQGTVIIQAVTDIWGKVVKTTVLSGHPLLNGAATEAVKKWLYEPYIINGMPKPVVFTVTVNFRLHN